MTKLASPLSRSASISQVNSLPTIRKFVGAGGGLRSTTVVSLTYSIQDRAIASFGNQQAFDASPSNFAAGSASIPVGTASQAPSVAMAWSGWPLTFGKRALRHASSHGIAR